MNEFDEKWNIKRKTTGTTWIPTPHICSDAAPGADINDAYNGNDDQNDDEDAGHIVPSVM